MIIILYRNLISMLYCQELEALSNHYALLFNRRKAKLSPEQKSVYEGKLKEVQQIFNFSAENDESGIDLNKGKNIESGIKGSSDEMKNLHDSSVSNAAEMAAGYIISTLFDFLCFLHLSLEAVHYILCTEWLLYLFCRFTSTLTGLTVNDIIQRTARRLESLHSEGVHVCENILNFMRKIQKFNQL